MYGVSLSNGQIIYQKFKHMVKAMGNPVASTFTAKIYAEFRRKRMAGEIIFVDSKWQKGSPSIATLNSKLARFKAVFEKLKELGEWKGPNPLESIKPFRDHERPMSFLAKEEIALLLAKVSDHKRQDMLKIVKVCLSTGARWNEAAQLTGNQLSKFKITYTNTNNNKISVATLSPFSIFRSKKRPLNATFHYSLFPKYRVITLYRKRYSLALVHG
jgi:integrase